MITFIFLQYSSRVLLQMNKDNIQGVVIHIRKTSKKIVFIDIEPSDYKDKERITIVFKFWECGDVIKEVIRGEKKIHLGDLIQFKGCFENEVNFGCLEYQIISLWSDTNPNIAFVPKPPPSSGDNQDAKKLPCKEFINTGQCGKQMCLFYHTEDQKELIESRLDFVKKKKDKRVLVHENNAKIEASSNSQRARIFAEWIVNTFTLGNGCYKNVLNFVLGLK